MTGIHLMHTTPALKSDANLADNGGGEVCCVRKTHVHIVWRLTKSLVSPLYFSEVPYVGGSHPCMDERTDVPQIGMQSLLDGHATVRNHRFASLRAQYKVVSHI